jgi:ankyrin repeat protein
VTKLERQFVDIARQPCEPSSVEVMESLLSKIPSIVKSAGGAALAAAVNRPDYKNASIVRFLIDHGARFDYPANSWSPLHEACWRIAWGQLPTDTIRMVLEAGLAKASEIAIKAPHGGMSGNRTLLHICGKFGHADLTGLLLRHGAQSTVDVRLNGDGETALQIATKPYHWKDRRDAVAQILLAHGADYDACSACAMDDGQRLKSLLRGDPSIAGDDVLLHSAAAAGSVDCAEMLLAHNANVNSTDGGLKTPLHKAAAPIPGVPKDWPFPDTRDVTYALLYHGAGIDAQDSQGRTPLHWAAYEGNVLIAEILILMGASLSKKNRKGQRPLDVARKDCLHLKSKTR